DLNVKAVPPGMINAHTPLYSSLALGMRPPEKPPANFVGILEEIWWKLDRALDEESNHASFEAGMTACLRAGVTTVFDHHSSQEWIGGSLEMSAAVAEEFGINLSPAFEITDRNGRKGFEAGLEENIDFLSGNADNHHIKPLLGMHASFTLSDESLRIIAERIKDSGAGIHIHAAEDAFDQEDAERRGYRSVIGRLNKFGLLNENSIVVHGLYFDEEDHRILEQTKTMLVHCPTSNANNRVGIIGSSAVAKVRAGLGTDGMQANMLKEAKEGSFIRSSHLSGGETGIDYLRLLFKHNPDLASRIFRRKIGHIAPGCQADLAIYDYRERSALNKSNYGGHLLFGLGKPSDVISRGKFRIMGGEFVDLNEKRIRANSVKQSKRLWQKMQEK
nr:amidohydrolase family protein [FCB group bacterium]